MPRTPSTCPLDCPDACGVLVEHDERGGFVSVRGEPGHAWSRGTLCRKTMGFGELFTGGTRLLTPLLRHGPKGTGELRPASWEQALARIAERVGPLEGERILAAWYGGTMGRVQKSFPLRSMHALGATLVDGGICDSTSSAGYEAVLGEAYGADLERADESDLLLLWGCDMSRTAQHLQRAAVELARRGDPVAAIDVYRTDSIRSIERRGGEGFLLRPGTDAQLALCLARLAFERGHADPRALADSCLGAEEFERHVRGAHGIEETSRITGLAPERIERLSKLLSGAQRPLLKTGVGFARRRNGGMSMRAVCSLAVVLGLAERVHYESAACFAWSDDRVERPDLRPGGDPAPTIRQVQTGAELESGRFAAVFVWSHNPAVVCPDAARVRRALASDELFVVVHDPFLTETAALADVVLPATLFAEHPDLYRSYGHRRLRYARKALTPPAGPRSNVDAFRAIARALGLPPETWEVEEAALCDELLQANAERFEEEQLTRLRAGDAVRCEPPHPVGNGTPSGRVELYSAALERIGQPPMATYVPDDGCDEPGAFWLVSAPSVHTHNSTFSQSPRHLARAGPPRAWLCAEEAQRIGAADGSLVTLSNPRGELSMILAVTSDMPPGLVRVDGLPRAADVPEGVGINALVPDVLSDIGDGNVLYSTRVDVRPAQD